MSFKTMAIACGFFAAGMIFTSLVNGQNCTPPNYAVTAPAVIDQPTSSYESMSPDDWGASSQQVDLAAVDFFSSDPFASPINKPNLPGTRSMMADSPTPAVPQTKLVGHSTVSPTKELAGQSVMVRPVSAYAPTVIPQSVPALPLPSVQASIR